MTNIQKKTVKQYAVEHALFTTGVANNVVNMTESGDMQNQDICLAWLNLLLGVSANGPDKEILTQILSLQEL